MTRLGNIRERFLEGRDMTTDDLQYVLDTVDVLEAFMLSESVVPLDICQPCKYHVAGVHFGNCDQPMDDCIGPMELFFEKALALWVQDIQEDSDDGL